MKEAVRKIGPYEVLLLLDGQFEAPSDVLIHIDGPDASQTVVERWGKPNVRMDVNCFALRGPDGIALVDAGTGNAWGPDFGAARQVLAARGIKPGDVRRVLLTHIHGDHALGLLADDDTPYFSEAEIWVPEVDLSFFTDTAARQAVPEARRGGFSAAEKIVRAYGTRIRSFRDRYILDQIEAVPLPGHTPGHTGYRLQGDDGDLLLLGDVLHIAELQAADPGIGLVFDLDPATAAANRKTLLGEIAGTGVTIAGGHLRGFSRVERMGDTFRTIQA